MLFFSLGWNKEVMELLKLLLARLALKLLDVLLSLPLKSFNILFKGGRLPFLTSQLCTQESFQLFHPSSYHRLLSSHSRFFWQGFYACQNGGWKWLNNRTNRLILCIMLQKHNVSCKESCIYGCIACEKFGMQNHQMQSTPLSTGTWLPLTRHLPSRLTAERAPVYWIGVPPHNQWQMHCLYYYN